MKWSLFPTVLALASLPALSLHAQDDRLKDRDITLRACVVPGIDKDTFVLTQVREIDPPDDAPIPSFAHGRHIIFWLDDDDGLADHVGRMVEVKGEIEDFEESEIEFKAGRHADGGLIVEFEGPGDDVKVAAEALGPSAVGTAGQAADGKDVKTFLLKVDVEDIEGLDQTCVQPTR